MNQSIAIMLLGILIDASSTAGHSALPANAPSCIELRDQYGVPHKITFPNSKVTVLAIADRKGSKQLERWIATLHSRYEESVDFRGLANVDGVPGFLRGMVQKLVRQECDYPVLLDWSGEVCERMGFRAGVANILLLDQAGEIHARFHGPANDSVVADARAALEKLL